MEAFSAATRLKINYNKGTIVPMHTPANQVEELVGGMDECQVGAFPQTYLCLPLSCDELRLSAFAPLICKSDKYLAGLQSTLQVGRLLHQVTLDALDKRRRAFLWSGHDQVPGAQCLVA